MTTVRAQTQAGAVVGKGRGTPGPDEVRALPHRWLRVVRLHYSDLTGMLVTTPVTLALLTVFSVAVYLVLRAYVVPAHVDLGAFFRGNMGVLWMLPGFLASVGAFSYARTMPYAVGMLGCTRGEYWRGTLVWAVLQAGYAAAVVVAFLLMEKATGTWFTDGAHVFDVATLGDGHVGHAALVSLCVGLASLLLGSCLAIAWLRWKQWGVIGGFLILAVVLLGGVTGLLALGVDVMGLLAEDTLVRLSLLVLAVAVLAGALSRLLLGRAPVAR